MNRPISDHTENRDPIESWIAEAGDPHVEPRAEHADLVRARLFERLGSMPRRARSRSVLAVQMLPAACILLAGLVVLIQVVTQPANAWARVAQAVQEKLWIHIVSRSGDRVVGESWASSKLGIFAAKHDHGPAERSISYHDLEAGIKTEYVAAENTIYRTPEIPGFQGRQSLDTEAFRQFLRADAFKNSPIPGTEIVEQSSRDVAEQGKTWKQFEVTIRWKEGPKSVVKMVIRVDPATRLPHTWDTIATEGTVRQTFDYPETGPADILAMGVPATAKRVDRVPGDDLNQVLNGLKVGRNRFDDYCGYTWFEGDRGANVRRVWRKGNKWRVEDVQRLVVTKAELRRRDVVPFRIPLGVDLGFWKVHEAELVFIPMAICDGQTIWYYHSKGTIVPDQPYDPKLESVNKHSVYGSPDDPRMPWPHLLPEQQSHPNVYVPTPDRAISIEPKPADGPAGTIRISVRDTQFQDAKRPDVYRLWVDPEKNFLAMRAETCVLDPASPRTKNGTYTKIAYVDAQTITNLDRSPSGFWYPTRVVRKTSNFPNEQVTCFLLDFRAEVPDSLFRPVE